MEKLKKELVEKISSSRKTSNKYKLKSSVKHIADEKSLPLDFNCQEEMSLTMPERKTEKRAAFMPKDISFE